MITLTPDQMLDTWKMLRGYAPLRSDCIVERYDGVDIDAMMWLEIDAWYTRLLDTAPAPLLPVSDIAASSALIPAPDGSGIIMLPEGCRRVVEVKLGGWERPARILSPDDPDYNLVASRQLSPFARGNSVSPVAMLEDRRLRLYTPPAIPAHPAIERLAVIIRPQNQYIFDQSLLRL